MTSPPAAPVAAPGCTDCAVLAGGRPVTPGQELELRYAGFQPGEQVALTMRSAPVDLGTFTADPDGVVTARVTIPESAEEGAHTLTFSGPMTGDHVVDLRLVSTEVPTVSAAAPVESDAGPVLPLAAGGSALVLLLAGWAGIRRRHRAPGQAPDDAGQPTATPVVEPIA
ncbi:MAG TPA: hypothetical protein VFG13_00610 [Blastococcus sp.]|nr:hypothetical protein [Blastococcus sp.]